MHSIPTFPRSVQPDEMIERWLHYVEWAAQCAARGDLAMAREYLDLAKLIEVNYGPENVQPIAARIELESGFALDTPYEHEPAGPDFVGG